MDRKASVLPLGSLYMEQAETRDAMIAVTPNVA